MIPGREMIFDPFRLRLPTAAPLRTARPASGRHRRYVAMRAGRGCQAKISSAPERSFAGARSAPVSIFFAPPKREALDALAAAGAERAIVGYAQLLQG
jgi:hypothetical protein